VKKPRPPQRWGPGTPHYRTNNNLGETSVALGIPGRHETNFNKPEDDGKSKRKDKMCAWENQ